jgi:hypothetical protein
LIASSLSPAAAGWLVSSRRDAQSADFTVAGTLKTLRKALIPLARWRANQADDKEDG